MPAGSPPASSSANGVGALAPFVTELDRLAPSFDIRGEQIRIIRTPAEFYETLKVRPPRVNDRIGLMGLGSDTKSQETHLFVDVVHWKVGKGTHRNVARGVEE
jgi:hypothetical protein